MSAADAGGKNVLPPTVLSALQPFTSPEVLSSSGLHPFASSPEETITTLQRIMETTNQAALSLNAHLSLPLSNPKLLSLYRQHSSIFHTVRQSEQNAQHVIHSLRKRIGITFGEDIPLEKPRIAEWFLQRLLFWGKSAGMEVFNEPERDGRTTVVLGGKVLVIDIDFAVDHTDPENPIIDVATLKTAYAIPNSTADSSSGNSISMDAFLACAIRAFLKEVQKDDAQRDSVEAARLGSLLSDYFSYLMKLDHLALSEGDGGLRWFTVIDRMALEIEALASKEAKAVLQFERGTPTPPLDVFLLRAHALPLPYLTTPSISFLTYLSPLAYLKLLRTSAHASSPPSPNLPTLDVPLQHIRDSLKTHPRLPGITFATVVLSPTSPHDDSALPTIDPRPSYSIVPDAERIDFILPGAREVQALQGKNYSWILDFTESGKYPGVVMSQSRMREIELVLNPFGGENMPQTSPTSVHPPLQLRLNTPEEPGFVLETIPVRTLKEIWSILEIIREQCWLNEILSGCQWVPEGMEAPLPTTEPEDISVTEDELQAVLKGTIKPRSIPVNIHLPIPPPSPSTDSLFDTDTDMDMAPPPRARARVTMTSPERPPISGLVEIGVTFDPTRPRGVAVEITGAVGVDVNVEVLEEACRRGGLLGLPGRVWKKAHEV
ncbi:hypothetical protein C8Q74DRAFT_1312897 [Fomes fomentarius]|nr:hypothetical protein C8Q74DRAFT_1312897 [Fomes fomentarius]